MILFYLLAAHFVCDYPLQGDFLSRGKNHTNPIPGVPWYQCLIAHSFIHAGAVALITGVWWLGVLEFFAHFFIDYGKYSGLFGEGRKAFNIDQALHIWFKIIWFSVWLTLSLFQK